MLIVAGSFITSPGAREPFLAAVQPMVAATLEEAGCHEYAFTPDPNDDNRILLYELWEDQSALDAHFESAHMASWQDSPARQGVVSASVKRYLISSVESLR